MISMATIMRIIPMKRETLFFGGALSLEGEKLFFFFVDELVVVFCQEIPVPGIDTELV